MEGTVTEPDCSSPPSAGDKHLAAQVARSRNFRWMRGMLSLPSEEALSLPVRVEAESDWPHDIGLRVPDLADPATGGLLLHLLSSLCQTETRVVALSSGTDEWEVWTLRGRSSGASLGEAAAGALLLLGD